MLLSADIAKVKDPYPYMNIIISQINEKKIDDALVLIGKLMAQFPNENSLYYYRGRAHLAANKLPEAKADLEKFVAGAARDCARAARREEDSRADEGHQVRAALVALLLLFLTACGGDGNGDGNGNGIAIRQPPGPAPRIPARRYRSEELLAPAVTRAPAKVRGFDGSPQWRVLDALWSHQDATDAPRRRSRPSVHRRRPPPTSARLRCSATKAT